MEVALVLDWAVKDLVQGQRQTDKTPSHHYTTSGKSRQNRGI
jgi:hypothetical protein